MNTQVINKITFYNLAPLIISASEWEQLAQWQKDQLEHDNNNVRLNHNFRIESSDIKNKTIVFINEFKKPTLLAHTPNNWILPNTKFDIHSDVYNIIHKVGGSLALFKFINKTNGYKPAYKWFEKNIFTKFENYTISMVITLVKSSSTEFSAKTFDVKTEVGQTLSLPIISEDYSHYIWHKTNRDAGTNSANYWQSIYFPMMLQLGYANYDKYEANNKKFDQANNPGWDHIIVKVTYTKKENIEVPSIINKNS
jgi:hypothetical protein